MERRKEDVSSRSGSEGESERDMGPQRLAHATKRQNPRLEKPLGRPNGRAKLSTRATGDEEGEGEGEGEASYSESADHETSESEPGSETRKGGRDRLEKRETKRKQSSEEEPSASVSDSSSSSVHSSDYDNVVQKKTADNEEKSKGRKKKSSSDDDDGDEDSEEEREEADLSEEDAGLLKDIKRDKIEEYGVEELRELLKKRKLRVTRPTKANMIAELRNYIAHQYK